MPSQQFLYALMLILAALLIALRAFAAPIAKAQDLPDEVIVTGIGLGSGQDDEAGNIASISQHEISFINPTHPSEILNRLPGFNIQHGSGQEHLTAIRSPVLTGGAGAGSFLYLEDGVSLRAPGFANVNGLFEAMTELAGNIETVRGPGSALYGSNAVHGTINVKSRDTQDFYQGDASLRFGTNPFLTHLITSQNAPIAPQAALRLGFSYLLDQGWRDSSGVQHFKGQMRYDHDYDHDFGKIKLKALLSAQGLNQQTAGFSRIYQSRPDILDNANPDAYRKAQSVRGQINIKWEQNQNSTLELTSWFRWTDLDFLQHFLPRSMPLEENQHASFGIRPIWHQQWAVFEQNLNLAFGGEIEHTDGSLNQTQTSVNREGSGGNCENCVGDFEFPQGVHYDYDVDALTLALFTQNSLQLQDERTSFHLGLRLEWTRYDYDNKTDDGRFGRFYRPSDQDDDFLTITPKVGVNYRLPEISGHKTYIFTNYTRGSRAPQTTDLYRLHVNQQGGDKIKAERLDSVELGLRGRRQELSWEIVGFYMNKSRHNFRDADFETFANGKTRHAGLELQTHIPLGAGLSWQMAFTYAQHWYAFDHEPSGIKKGDDIDSAPRILLNTELAYTHERGRVAFELVHVGDYYTDPANEHSYPGHYVFNLYAEAHIWRDVSFFFNIRNIADKRFADRADFAFGNERYFPGQPRAFFLGLKSEF